MTANVTRTGARDSRTAHRGKVTWLSEVFAFRASAVSWARGVLFLDVALVPLVVFAAIGHEEYLLSALFGAVFAVLTDPGGPIGRRELRMAVFAAIGAGLTALAFGLGGAAWGWLVVAAFVVTLVAGLGILRGGHGVVAATLLTVWFIIALALGVALHQQPRIGSHVWAQVLAWVGGAALWIAVSVVIWLARGRRDAPPPVAEIPGDTAARKLTSPVILFAVIRAVAIAGSVALAFGLGLSHADWLPIATIVAMKPSLGQSTVSAAQRVVGAVIGAVAAALLLLVPASESGLRLVSIDHALETVAVVLLVHAVAIRLWNYAVYTGAVAAAVLVLEDLVQPSDYSAEGERVLWTMAGAGIGVFVMLLAGLLTRRTRRSRPAVSTGA